MDNSKISILICLFNITYVQVWKKCSGLVKMSITNSLFFFFFFLTLKLGLSRAGFSLIVARFQFPGEPCLHRYIYLLEDYSGVCIRSEFKHTVFFL